MNAAIPPLLYISSFSLMTYFFRKLKIECLGVFILVSENILWRVVTLNTNLQLWLLTSQVIKVIHCVTLLLLLFYYFLVGGGGGGDVWDFCGVFVGFLQPCNHFNFNPKDLQDTNDHYSSPLIFM